MEVKELKGAEQIKAIACRNSPFKDLLQQIEDRARDGHFSLCVPMQGPQALQDATRFLKEQGFEVEDASYNRYEPNSPHSRHYSWPLPRRVHQINIKW